MITKRHLIDLLHNRLSEGDAPDDIKGKYHPQVIEAVVDTVFSEIVIANPALMKELAIPFTVTPALTNEVWQAATPTNLAFNSKSLVLVYGCDPDDWYIVRDGIIGNQMMQVLKPNPGRVSIYQDNNQLKFTSKPYSTVTIYAIPNVSAMDEDDQIIMPGKEATFLSLAYQAIRSMDTRPMEVLNDQKPDTE